MYIVYYINYRTSPLPPTECSVGFLFFSLAFYTRLVYCIFYSLLFTDNLVRFVGNNKCFNSDLIIVVTIKLEMAGALNMK